MPTVLGVDGCPHGWCAVRLDTDARTLRASHHFTFAGVLNAFPRGVIAIDVPIGLMDGPGGRECDREARRYLGPGRASSVFSPPARPALVHCGIKGRYRQACLVNEAATGARISQQAFWIGPKIREVDEAMKPASEKRVYEAHPEISFAALNSGRPMRHRKRTAAGRKERWRLLRRELPLPRSAALPDGLHRLCDLEDYADALACAWTAALIAAGKTAPMPEKPPRDGRGLRMAIWRPLP